MVDSPTVRRRKLDDVLRYLDGRARARLSSVLEAVETGAQCSSGTSSSSSGNRRSILDTTASNELKHRLVERLVLGAPTGIELEGRALTEENDTVAYPECVKDYAVFVEPVTNAVWNALSLAVCDYFGLPAAICDRIAGTLPVETMPVWGLRSTLHQHLKFLQKFNA